MGVLTIKSYFILLGTLVFIILLFFAAVEYWQIPILINPLPWLRGGGAVAACLGVLLLTVDVLVPVPSSIIMTANGAVFGVIIGTVLSLLGGLGASIIGFSLGSWGSPLVNRLVSEKDREKAHQLFKHWGPIAIVITRPIPVLAEAIVILAGTSSMSWLEITVASFVGLLPTALFYAVLGSMARIPGNFLGVLIITLFTAAAFWMLGRWWGKK